MDKIIQSGMIYIYPLLITLIVLEYLKAKDLYDVKETFSSFAIAAVSSLIVTFTKVVAFGVFVYLFDYFRDFRIEYLGPTGE